MSSFMNSPNALPSASTSRFSSTGFPSVSNEKPLAPLKEASATEMAMEYRTSPTTSSSATTCSSVSTKSPLAPVCRMVIIVEAGAVAEASAESTMENASSSRSTRNVRIKIKTEARTASKIVIQTTFIPLFFRTESLKNSPVENAMKASAISERKSVPSMMRCGTRFSTYGPMRIPARI